MFVHAVAKIDGSLVQMHRFVVDAPKGVLVDHHRTGTVWITPEATFGLLRPLKIRETEIHRGIYSRFMGVCFLKSKNTNFTLTFIA